MNNIRIYKKAFLIALALILHHPSVTYAMRKDEVIKEESGEEKRRPSESNTHSFLSREEEEPFREALTAFEGLRPSLFSQENLRSNSPHCFISYAPGNNDHDTLIHTLASHLKIAGINILIDAWQNKVGDNLHRFSEKILDETTDFVIVVGSKKLMEHYTTIGGRVNLELNMLDTVVTRF